MTAATDHARELLALLTDRNKRANVEIPQEVLHDQVVSPESITKAFYTLHFTLDVVQDTAFGNDDPVIGDEELRIEAMRLRERYRDAREALAVIHHAMKLLAARQL